MYDFRPVHGRFASPSSRRAWIEIGIEEEKEQPSLVALLAEGVDRNSHSPSSSAMACVALLAEGVDRNASYAVEYDWYIRRPPRGGRG